MSVFLSIKRVVITILVAGTTALVILPMEQALAGGCFHVSIGHHGHHRHYGHHHRYNHHRHHGSYHYYPHYARHSCHHEVYYYEPSYCHHCEEEREVEAEFRLISVTTVTAVEHFDDGIQVTLANGIVAAIERLSIPSANRVRVDDVALSGPTA